MKTSIKALVAIISFGATALFIQAQPALKVGTIDLGKALAEYYRTAEEDAKLKGFEAEANKNAEKIISDGRELSTKLQSQVEALKSPVLNETAKKAAEADAQNLYAEIQKKQQELNEYQQMAVRNIQTTVNTTRAALIGEINVVATDLAKKKGITMLVERNACVYADAAYDITSEVVAEINKNKPATTGTSTVPSVGLPK